jgi:hypothetical protein
MPGCAGGITRTGRRGSSTRWPLPCIARTTRLSSAVKLVCGSGLQPLPRDQLTWDEVMQEVWQPVVGYESLYEVSDQGRVRSLPGQRWNGQAIHEFNGRILKPQYSSRYVHVALSRDGRVKCKKIHQLVAEAFLPPCPGIQGKRRGCYQIDHVNNNPLDNRASNLQWLTQYENTYVKPARRRDQVGRFA